MAQDLTPFDREREEERLNAIFSQILSENEGTRNNAATALHNWMGKHDLQPRLTLNRSSADRTVRVIDDLERRNRVLLEENTHLRTFIGKEGVRQVEQLQRAMAGGLLDEFIQAVKGMYNPVPLEIPRGAAKAIAVLLSLSETTARQMLRGRRTVGAEEIARIRSAPRISAPRHAKRRRKPRACKPGQIEPTRLNGSMIGA